MILQRLASTIRHQNWSQIIIEILIVVIGIFLGLQVTDWNDERQERVQENIYIHRLHNEVITAIERKKSYVDYRATAMQNNGVVLDILSGKIQADVITQIQCNGILETHMLSDPSLILPTLSELLSSGRISYLKDDSLTSTLSEYLIAMDELDDSVAEMRLSAVVLPQEHPELIIMPLALDTLTSYTPGDLSATVDVRCNLELMRESRSFQNDYVTNIHRQVYYFKVMESELSTLMKIHKIIDENIGVVHD